MPTPEQNEVPTPISDGAMDDAHNVALYHDCRDFATGLYRGQKIEVEVVPYSVSVSLEKQLTELRQLADGILKSVKDSKYAHVLCKCDYGCDGRLPLRGELCDWHKAQNAYKSFLARHPEMGEKK